MQEVNLIISLNLWFILINYVKTSGLGTEHNKNTFIFCKSTNKTNLRLNYACESNQLKYFSRETASTAIGMKPW